MLWSTFYYKVCGRYTFRVLKIFFPKIFLLWFLIILIFNFKQCQRRFGDFYVSQSCHSLRSSGPIYSSTSSPSTHRLLDRHTSLSAPQILHFLQSQHLCTSSSLCSSPDLSVAVCSSSFQPLPNTTPSTTSNTPTHTSITVLLDFLHSTYLPQIVLFFGFHAFLYLPTLDVSLLNNGILSCLPYFPSIQHSGWDKGAQILITD